MNTDLILEITKVALLTIIAASMLFIVITMRGLGLPL